MTLTCPVRRPECFRTESRHGRFGSNAAVGEAKLTTYQNVLNGRAPLVPWGLLGWPRQQLALPNHTAITRSSCALDRDMQVVMPPFPAPMAGLIVTLPLRPD